MFCCLVAAARAEPVRADRLDDARQLIRDGALDQAVTLLREVVQQEPNNAAAHLLLGRAFALLPDATNALASLRRAVELRPSSAETQYTLGTVLARFGNLEAAGEAFERAIALEPGMADAHVGLALLLAQRQQLSAARTHIAKALDAQGRSPASAYSHYLMAQILRQEKQHKRALQHLEAAIDRRADYAEAYVSLGLVKNELLDERGALEAFETAVRLSPDDPIAQAELGGAFLRDSRAEEAVVHLEHAHRLRPADRTAFYNLCRAYQLADRASDAASCFQQLSGRVDAESGQADLSAAEANNQGLDFERRGDLHAALERYRTAVSLSPYNPLLRRNLALALCRLGRWDEGIAELRKVLDANPDDQDAIKALHIAMERVRADRER
jgi:tetratricopeptide (TPR) repeat protein